MGGCLRSIEARPRRAEGVNAREEKAKGLMR